MANPIETRNDKLGQRVTKALIARSFEACYVKTKQEALAKSLEYINPSDTVSFGGSCTINEIGLIEELKKRGYSLIDRGTDLKSEESINKMRQALTADTFLMSANAISEDGVLVNIDGRGNRIAALCFGPKSIIVVAGINKIAHDTASALSRARNTAAPINAQRMGSDSLPCVISGCCADCKRADTICNHILFTRVSRPEKRIKVIIVGENLGY